MSELTGKVAIVTGGSAGIGRATAMALAAAGAAVIVADVDDDRGTQVAADIEQQGGRARFVHTDVTDDHQVEAMVRAAVDTYGGLDVAFNNAGTEGVPAPTHECTPENWQRTLAVNLTGLWSCMRHEIPRMLDRGGGSIGSPAARTRPRPPWCPWSRSAGWVGQRRSPTPCCGCARTGRASPPARRSPSTAASSPAEQRLR